jgi:hypothetical protein
MLKKGEGENVCQRVQCPVCNKPSFVGCGRHVEQVLGDVPPEDRCRCREESRGAADKEQTFLQRLFGKPLP